MNSLTDKHIPSQVERLYRSLFRIRLFEQTVLENFPKGVFSGTTHTYLGQEANAVGVLDHLGDVDIVFSSHRCHGHFLAYGGDIRALFAELMGKATGVCGGRGGSQHLHWHNFYSNGVQGGITPIAAGMALAEKTKCSGAIVFIFIGDGTLGEGVLYEALNMSALWSLPILFILENNRIAQTTPVEMAVAGPISARFEAFGIPYTVLDTSDVLPIHAAALISVEQVRQLSAPRALVLHTYRFGPHSKGDDTRTEADLRQMKQERDPITIHATRLSPERRAEIEAKVSAEIQKSYQQALEDPYPELAHLKFVRR